MVESKPEIRTESSPVSATIGRTIAQGYYSFQKVRIANMNNIRDIVRKTLEGIGFSTVEEKKDKSGRSFEKKYTDAQLIEALDRAVKEQKLTQREYDYLHNCYIVVKGGDQTKQATCPHCKKKFEDKERIAGINRIENEYKKLMESYIVAEKIYEVFLSKIRGIGPVLSANIINAFGECRNYIFDPKEKKVIAREGIDANYNEIRKDVPRLYKLRGFPTVSSLWSYTGNNVVDGKAPKRKKGEKLNFDAGLRSMTYLISDSLMKQNRGYYRKIYESEKEKQAAKVFQPGELALKYGAKEKKKKVESGSEAKPKGEGKGYKETDLKLSKGHVHNRALRKVRKHILAHYWECSREIVGLPVERTYVEEVLQHQHIIGWKEAVAMEDTYEKKLVVADEGEFEEEGATQQS